MRNFKKFLIEKIIIFKRKNFLILNNTSGVSITGGLVAAAVGVILLAGVAKSLIFIADQIGNLDHIRTLIEIKTNVISMLRNEKAWYATVKRSPGGGAGGVSCFPGNENSGGSKCPINLWYNEANPDDPDEYNTIQSESPGSDYAWLRKWACNPAGKNYGLAFAGLDGGIIYPSGCCNDTAACAGTSKFVKIEIYPPAQRAEGEANLPVFQIKFIDEHVTKTESSFNVIGLRLKDSGFTSGTISDVCNIALGENSSALGDCSISIGGSATTVGDKSIALGFKANDAEWAGDEDWRIQLGNPAEDTVNTPKQEPFMVVQNGGSVNPIAANSASSVFADSIYANQVFARDGVAGSNQIHDYVFDLYFDGKISEADKKVAGDFKIYEIPELLNFVSNKDNRHLPYLDGRKELKASGKISLGKLFSQFIQTAEAQAIYIKELYETNQYFFAENEGILSEIDRIEDENMEFERENLKTEIRFKELLKENESLKEQGIKINRSLRKLKRRLERLKY